MEIENPPDIVDPGFVLPVPYLMRTYKWLIWFHVLPESGGLNDQDQAWVDDVELLMSMKAQVQREYRAIKDVPESI